MKNSTINGEEITDELRRKIASRLREIVASAPINR